MTQKTEYSAAFQEASDMVWAHRHGGDWKSNPHPDGSDASRGWEDGEDFALDDDRFDD